jgi:hypothetical protein
MCATNLAHLTFRSEALCDIPPRVGFNGNELLASRQNSGRRIPLSAVRVDAYIRAIYRIRSYLLYLEDVSFTVQTRGAPCRLDMDAQMCLRVEGTKNLSEILEQLNHCQRTKLNRFCDLQHWLRVSRNRGHLHLPSPSLLPPRPYGISSKGCLYADCIYEDLCCEGNYYSVRQEISRVL